MRRLGMALTFFLLLAPMTAFAQGIVPIPFTGAGIFSTPTTASKFSCTTGSSCAVTITTHAGDYLVAAMVTTTAPPNGFISATGCNTSWGVAPYQPSFSTTAYTDWTYCPNATADTSITFTFWTSLTTPSIVVWDTPNNGLFNFFDTINGVYDSSNCTSCTGTALTMNMYNDAIFTFAVPDNTLSAVSSPYVADQSFPGGSGMAHVLNTTSGTAPTWTQSPTGPMVSGAMAISTQPGGPGFPLAYGDTTHTSGTTFTISYTPYHTGDPVAFFWGAVVTTGTCSISDGTNTYVTPTLGTGSNPTRSSAASIWNGYVQSFSAASPEITCPTDTNRAIILAEMYGVSTLDQSGMEVETAGTGGAWTGPNITTTAYPELILVAVACDEYCSAGSGWTPLTRDADGSIMEYKRALAGTVTVTPSGTDSAGSGATEIVWWQSWH